jgi:hypothetical protein
MDDKRTRRIEQGLARLTELTGEPPTVEQRTAVEMIEDATTDLISIFGPKRTAAMLRQAANELRKKPH